MLADKAASACADLLNKCKEAQQILLQPGHSTQAAQHVQARLQHLATPLHLLNDALATADANAAVSSALGTALGDVARVFNEALDLLPMCAEPSSAGSSQHVQDKVAHAQLLSSATETKGQLEQLNRDITAALQLLSTAVLGGIFATQQHDNARLNEAVRTMQASDAALKAGFLQVMSEVNASSAAMAASQAGPALEPMALEEKSQLKGHSDVVTCVAISPDGKTVVSGSVDTSIRVWDLVSRRERFKLERHTKAVLCLAISPDGETLVSGSMDMTVRVWNLVTGQEELQLAKGHCYGVFCVAISPNGKTIVSGGAGGNCTAGDAAFCVWDMWTGQRRRVLEVLRWCRVLSVAISPDSKTFVTGSGDKNVCVWDMLTGQQRRVLKGHTNVVESVAISRDGGTIVSGSWDRTLRVWDLISGQERCVLEGHTARVTSVTISSDGETIVSGSTDRTVRVWDMLSGQEKLKLEGHSNSVLCVAISPDGKTIVSASDKTVRIWAIAVATPAAPPLH